MGVAKVQNTANSSSTADVQQSNNANQSSNADAALKFDTALRKANDGGPGSPAATSTAATPTPNATATKTTMPAGTFTSSTGAPINNTTYETKANDGGPGSPTAATATPIATSTNTTMPAGTLTTSTGAPFNASTASAKANDNYPIDYPPGTTISSTGVPFNANSASAKANDGYPIDYLPGTYFSSTGALSNSNTASVKANDGSAFDTPTDWSATSPAGSAHPGKDPFNVIISGNSNVSMQQLETALAQVQHPVGAPALEQGTAQKGQIFRGPQSYAHWQTVETGTNPLLGQGTGPEFANVAPQGQGNAGVQQVNMRQGGVDTTFADNINHFRAYQQSSTGAWLVAASREDFDWGSLYHRVDNYNQAGQDLVADIKTAGQMQGWKVTATDMGQVQDPGRGSNDISYNGHAYLITITAPPSSASA